MFYTLNCLPYSGKISLKTLHWTNTLTYLNRGAVSTKESLLQCNLVTKMFVSVVTLFNYYTNLKKLANYKHPSLFHCLCRCWKKFSYNTDTLSLALSNSFSVRLTWKNLPNANTSLFASCVGDKEKMFYTLHCLPYSGKISLKTW